MEVKHPKTENEFVGEEWTTLSPIMAQKLPQKGCELEFCNQITKDLKLQCFSLIRPYHYAIATENTTRQGVFMGGPKLENDKSKIGMAATLEIYKPVYLCHFLANLHQIWSAVSYWPYEGYWGPK